MNWHTNVTVGDLHYLRSKFAESQGANGIYLSSFIKATESFYYSRQFRVNGDYFLTWAFLTPENEINYLFGKFDWLNNISQGNTWITEAYIPKKAFSCLRELSGMSPTKTIRFILGNSNIRKIDLLRFDRRKKRDLQ